MKIRRVEHFLKVLQVFICCNYLEIPFEFKLQKTSNHQLIETYHGVFVNITYKIHLNIVRGYFSKEIKKVIIF
jgi:hypothetical protein